MEENKNTNHTNWSDAAGGIGCFFACAGIALIIYVCTLCKGCQ